MTVIFSSDLSAVHSFIPEIYIAPLVLDCTSRLCTRLCGAPPFWHRRQLIMLRAIMDGNFDFNHPEWSDVRDICKDLVSNGSNQARLYNHIQWLYSNGSNQACLYNHMYICVRTGTRQLGPGV